MVAQEMAGLSPFTVMINILLLNAANSIKTFRENSLATAKFKSDAVAKLGGMNWANEELRTRFFARFLMDEFALLTINTPKKPLTPSENLSESKEAPSRCEWALINTWRQQLFVFKMLTQHKLQSDRILAAIEAVAHGFCGEIFLPTRAKHRGRICLKARKSIHT